MVVLAIGCRACINGLTARPDLNGVAVTLMEWFEAEQRWGVHDAAGRSLMVRPTNLLVDGFATIVKRHNLKDRSEAVASFLTESRASAEDLVAEFSACFNVPTDEATIFLDRMNAVQIGRASCRERV